jgi:hypothetical protein
VAKPRIFTLLDVPVVGLGMFLLNRGSFIKSISNNRFKLTEVFIFAFWYMAMFPGRVGFDGSAAIKMIQKNESTDLWTATFFWYLKIFTFGGNSIYLASFISYLFLTISLKYFIFSLPANLSVLKKTYLIMLATPIVSVFGLTLSHDSTQVSGILILVGFHLRSSNVSRANDRFSVLVLSFAYAGLMTTHFGLALIFLDLVLQFIRKVKVGATLTFISVLLFLLSSLGISRHDPSANTAWMVADLKCIAQHGEARLNNSDWIFLQSIAPKSEWLNALSCTTVDEPVGSLRSRKSEAMIFSPDFAISYIRVVMKNPAIVGMAHIQRSRGALPPPFFQGPDNQVELDPAIPIGQGTNIALQNSFEMLHPSVDESSVDLRVPLLKPLELIGQGLTFLVNQASWFWGWGGLWLWPLIYFHLTRIHGKRVVTRLKALFPVLLLHILLVSVGPAPLPRYVMVTVIAGITATLILLLEWYERTSLRLNKAP